MANLLGIITNVIEDTGRLDLVASAHHGDYTDNGIVRHVNAGQRWLDTHFEYKGDSAFIYKVLAAGQTIVTFNKARYIEEVFLMSNGGRRRALRFKNARELLTSVYPEVDQSEIDRGEPMYWTLRPVGLAPEQYDLDADDLLAAGAVDYQWLQYGNYYLLDSIIVAPPPDQAYTLAIRGRYYSKELLLPADVSFWSVNRPELLEDSTKASIMRRLSRNATGYKDVTDPILADLRQLAYDMYSEEVAGPAKLWRMRG